MKSTKDELPVGGRNAVAMTERLFVEPDARSAKQRVESFANNAEDPEIIEHEGVTVPHRGCLKSMDVRKVELRDYVERPFSRGGWTGNIASMGARSVDAGPNAPVGESAVHVRLAAQKGNLVAYVRFQSGAGDDLDDAIAHGRAVVTDALTQFPR